jgi:hypothetical protein
MAEEVHCGYVTIQFLTACILILDGNWKKVKRKDVSLHYTTCCSRDFPTDYCEGKMKRIHNLRRKSRASVNKNKKRMDLKDTVFSSEFNS